MQASGFLLFAVGHGLILFQWQRRAGLKIGFAATAPGPHTEPDKRKKYYGGQKPAKIVDIHHGLPASPTIRAKFLQIRNERIHFGLAFDIRSCGRYLLISVRITEQAQPLELGCDQFGVDIGFGQPWIPRHVGLGYQCTRICQM
jgi:hypothetical protein